jgi:hypothetical protein
MLCISLKLSSNKKVLNTIKLFFWFLVLVV